MKRYILFALALSVAAVATASTADVTNCVAAGIPYAPGSYWCNPYNPDGSADTSRQVFCQEQSTGPGGTRLVCPQNNTLPAPMQGS